jgi:hypothetical protein
MRGASTCFCAIRISWPNDIRIAAILVPVRWRFPTPPNHLKNTAFSETLRGLA